MGVLGRKRKRGEGRANRLKLDNRADHTGTELAHLVGEDEVRRHREKWIGVQSSGEKVKVMLHSCE